MYWVWQKSEPPHLQSLPALITCLPDCISPWPAPASADITCWQSTVQIVFKVAITAHDTCHLRNNTTLKPQYSSKYSKKKNKKKTQLNCLSVFIQCGTAYIAFGFSLQGQWPLHHRLKSFNITSSRYLQDPRKPLHNNIQKVSQIF